jgi:hypothetical protein
MKTTYKYSTGAVYLYLLFNIYKTFNRETNRRGEKMRNMIMSFAEKFNGKEVKIMKSLLAIVIAITMVISTSGLSFAAFSSIGSETFSASTSVEGSGSVTVPFEANLKNLSNDAGADSISWTDVSAGETGWLAANQYIAVKGFATYSDWGIQIYTNNTNYTGTGNPVGLVNTSNTIYSLPMAWRTKTSKLAAGNNQLDIVESIVDGSQVLADGTGQEYYPWFYMLDKKTDMDDSTSGLQTFGTHHWYATFIGSAGYQHAPTDYASPEDPGTTYYVYLGAKFTMAMPGATYTTNSLTVEMYRL